MGHPERFLLPEREARGGQIVAELGLKFGLRWHPPALIGSHELDAGKFFASAAAELGIVRELAVRIALACCLSGESFLHQLVHGRIAVLLAVAICRAALAGIDFGSHRNSSLCCDLQSICW